jgi:hypothetical protein
MRSEDAMSDAGMTHDLPGHALWILLFAAFVLGMVGAMCARRWLGMKVPDRVDTPCCPASFLFWQPMSARCRCRHGLRSCSRTGIEPA